jgi:hypothetical protein
VFRLVGYTREKTSELNIQIKCMVKYHVCHSHSAMTIYFYCLKPWTTGIQVILGILYRKKHVADVSATPAVMSAEEITVCKHVAANGHGCLWCLKLNSKYCTISFNSYVTRHRAQNIWKFLYLSRVIFECAKKSHKTAENCLQKFIFRPQGAYGKWGRGICEVFAILMWAEVNQVESLLLPPIFAWFPSSVAHQQCWVLQNWQRCYPTALNGLQVINHMWGGPATSSPSTKIFRCHACPRPSTKSKVRISLSQVTAPENWPKWCSSYCLAGHCTDTRKSTAQN